ncbi:MAG: N-6 DNA methylase [Prevotella sp.]|nr:N-6 DNA methylase [Prevotella sp.]
MNINTRYDIETYIANVNGDYVSGVTTEHSFRGFLQTLLRQLINDGVKKDSDKVTVINEATRKDYGAPDFEFRRNDVAIAFLETKKIGDPDLLGENSKQHKEQFDRYKNAVNLIAFTDYLRFHLYENGEQILSATIGRIENQQIVINEDPQQLSNFLKIVACLGAASPQPIRSAKLLAEVMAAKAKIIADILNKAMENGQTQEDKELHSKLDAFQKFLVHDMTVGQFTDFYAQTIVYGLFVARIYDKTPKSFSLQEAADLIPAINPFLKKIFKHLALADLHDGIRWIVEDLVTIFRVTDIGRVMHNYGKDPLVHFYEEFLEAYNPKIREDFGVWYTPHEVVSFIVNAVDSILREKLDTPKGLADNSMINYKNRTVHKVQILDPATGTGTFLAVAAEKIYKGYTDRGQEGRWPEDVVQNIIPRLNGFEYLMAPYTMAHLKVATALHLDDLQEQLPDRLNIFLTNSLDKDYPEERLDFAKFITDESNAASQIKRDTPVMVVIGNPPYNEKSANNGEWIMGLMDDYKQEPGMQRKNVKTKKNKEVVYKNTLQEKNPKGLNNDYCKFIRLGQNFVENTQEGVLAYICGNTFLDTSLFRGMRYELLSKFDEIYIINLHGSTKRNESTEKQKDECVFNIQVGVSINIFIKRKDGDNGQLARVYYKDVYGSQREKLQYLSEHQLNDIDFQEIQPSAPLYTFRIRNQHLREQYDAGFNIRELMTVNVQGFTTDKDFVAIQYEGKDVYDIVSAMQSDKDDAELRELYGFRDSRDWTLKGARSLLKAKTFGYEDVEKHISEVCYRPFDFRWTFFHKALVTYPRPLLQNSVHNKRNLVLCLGKEGSVIGDNEWSLVYISTLPTDKNVVPRGGVYLFPLFVYDQDGVAHVNFSEEILKKIEERTGLRLQSTLEDKELGEGYPSIVLLDYIYAVLHSTRYRRTYHECLQDGFPTIPYPSSAAYFFQMAKMGEEIRRLHLLKRITDDDFITTYSIRLPKNNNLCEKRQFVETGEGVGRVYINDQQYFGQVPTVAWNMVVAGYQPLDRWLKDRKGKQLTNEEIDHYQRMVVALKRQDDVVKEIDKTIEI